MCCCFCLGEEVRIPLRDLRPVETTRGGRVEKKTKDGFVAVFWGRRELGVEGGELLLLICPDFVESRVSI